jgi:hypothetical protein
MRKKMPRIPAGEIPKRALSAAVQTLESALSDPKTPAYVRIKAAQSLLDYAAAKANSPEPEKREPSKVIVLPSNGRERIMEERREARERVAAQLAAGKAEQPQPEPKKVVYVGRRKGRK